MWRSKAHVPHSNTLTAPGATPTCTSSSTKATSRNRAPCRLPAAVRAQVWDAGTGQIHVMMGATAGTDSLRLPLVLQPYEAKIVVVGALPEAVAAPELSFATGDTIAEFPIDAPVTQFQRQITLPSKAAGKRFYVECADVHDYA